MTNEALVFDVSESSYGRYVLLNSHKVPVVVGFLAAWSEHCMVLSDLFAELAREFAGEFAFAKVDIEENPGLAEQYRVEHAPALIVFKDGEPGRVEVGVLSEDEARALLKEYGIYRESEETRLQARALHMQGDTPKAITLLANAVRKDPGNTRIALDMVQIFIDIGEYTEAEALFERLPEEIRDSRTGKSLAGQLWINEQAGKTQGVEKLAERIERNADDHDARFDMALCKMKAHDYERALEQLLYIQEHEPGYRDGAARELIVTVLNMLAPGNPDFVQQYRRRLSSLLSA